jgi:hypothetical protein
VGLKSRLDEEMTWEQFLALASSVKRDLVLTLREWLRLSVPFHGTDGQPRPPVGSDGKVGVTETNSTSIYTDQNYILGWNVARDEPRVAVDTSQALASAPSLYRKRRIVRIQVTADGAGAFAFQTILAALAGYYGICRLVGVKANAVVAAGVLIFECPAATAELTEVMPALAANVRQTRLDVHYIATDNAALGVRGTTWGAGTVIDLEFEANYET